MKQALIVLVIAPIALIGFTYLFRFYKFLAVLIGITDGQYSDNIFFFALFGCFATIISIIWIIMQELNIRVRY